MRLGVNFGFPKAVSRAATGLLLPRPEVQIPGFPAPGLLPPRPDGHLKSKV